MPTTTTLDLDGISSGLTSVTPATLGWDSVDANLTPAFQESAAMITRTASNGDVVLSSTGDLTATTRYIRPFSETEALAFFNTVGDVIVTRYKLSFERGAATTSDSCSGIMTNRSGGDYGRLALQCGVSSTYAQDSVGLTIGPTECQDANDFGGSGNYQIGLEQDEIFYLDVYQARVASTGTNADYEWAYAINGRMLCLKQHGSFRGRTAHELVFNTSYWDNVAGETLYFLNVHEVTVTYDITGSSIKEQYDGIEDSTLGAWTDDSIVCLHGALYQVTGQAASTASTSRLEYDPCIAWEDITSVTSGTIDTQSKDSAYTADSVFGGLQYALTDPAFEVPSRLHKIPQHDGVAQLTIPIDQIGDNGVDFVVERDLGLSQSPQFTLRIDSGTGTTTNLKFVDNSGSETDTGITLTRSANRYTIFCFVRSDRASVVVTDREVVSVTGTHIQSWSSSSEGITLPSSSDMRINMIFSKSGTSSDFKFYGPTWGRYPITIESSYVSTGTTEVLPARIGARDRRLWDANSGRGPSMLTSGVKGGIPRGPFANLGRSGANIEEWIDDQIEDSAEFFDAWMGDIRVYDGRVNYVDEGNDGATTLALHQRLRDLANSGAGNTVIQIATTPSPHPDSWGATKTGYHRDSNTLLRADVAAGNWSGHYFSDITGQYATEVLATADFFQTTTDVHPGQGDADEITLWIDTYNQQLTPAPVVDVEPKMSLLLITDAIRRRR